MSARRASSSRSPTAKDSVLESRSRPNRVIDGPPYPHADTEGAWDWILTTLSELGARHPIGCIVPVAHGACAALVGEHDMALPILDYEHDISDVDADTSRWHATSSRPDPPDYSAA